MNEMFTDDGRIVTLEFDVGRGCTIDENLGMAFVISAGNQFTAEDGQWHQLLGERSTIPICLIKETEITDLKGLKDKIFREAHEGAKINQYKIANRNFLIDKILWIVTIPCVTLLIIFAARMWG